MLTALFGGLFIFAGIYTFGNGLLFDRIFIGVLVFTAIVCRKNINVVGVVVVLFLIRGLEEFSWFLMNSELGIIVKMLFYGVAGAVCYFVKYDNISKVLLVSLGICLCSEAYWYFSGENSPYVYWFLMVLSLNIVTRHFIFMRVSYTEDYFPGKATSINLDWHIYKLNAVAALIQCAMIIEYVLRNVAGFKQILFVYNVYPYMLQAISTYAIWITFHESYKLLIPKLLKA